MTIRNFMFVSNIQEAKQLHKKIKYKGKWSFVKKIKNGYVIGIQTSNPKKTILKYYTS